MAPAAEDGAMFPTQVLDMLDVPGVAAFVATLINAGIPTVFLNAQDPLHRHRAAARHQPHLQVLARLEAIRAWAALQMGLIADLAERRAAPAHPSLPPSATPRSAQTSRPALVCRCALSMGATYTPMGRRSVAICCRARWSTWPLAAVATPCSCHPPRLRVGARWRGWTANGR